MFGIDEGPSKQQNSQYGDLTSASGFATGLGESDLTASSNFMQAILSGDPTKISQVLAPQISAEKTSAQQQNKTAAEFGTRSGGTAASTAATNDKVHSDITNLVASLTGGAASSLASTGSSLLSTGISGDATGFGEATQLQKQRASKIGDIFSSGAGLASGILSGLPMGPGSFGDIGSNIFGAIS